jgi:DNA-directed RNA polymerase subunit RPC12/RpoP
MKCARCGSNCKWDGVTLDSDPQERVVECEKCGTIRLFRVGDSHVWSEKNLPAISIDKDLFEFIGGRPGTKGILVGGECLFVPDEET